MEQQGDDFQEIAIDIRTPDCPPEKPRMVAARMSEMAVVPAIGNLRLIAMIGS